MAKFSWGEINTARYNKLRPLTRVLQGIEFSPDGCWLWQRGLRGQHPKFRLRGKQLYVHRWMLETRLKRRLGPEELACHTCGNSLCVRPDHLYAGTVATNAQDRKEFGKSRVVLAQSEKLALYSEYLAGRSALKLSAEYGVTRRTAHYIISKLRRSCSAIPALIR